MTHKELAHPIKVLRFELGEPVHATSTIPDIEFSDLVGMNLGMGQSIAMNALRLMVDLNFNFCEFRHKGKRYRLALKNARLFLELANGYIEPGTSYRAELQAGEITQVATTKRDKETQTKLSGNLQGHADAGWTNLLPKWALSVRTDGGAAASRDRHNRSTEETKVTKRLELVGPAGQNCWMIGCPGSGDPRQSFGWLMYETISASDGDLATPLCVVSAVDQGIPVSVRLRVIAAREHFSLVDENSRDQFIDDLLLRFRKLNTETFAKRCKAERSLKARIAVLVATQKPKLPAEKETSTDAIEIMSRAGIFVPNPRNAS